jgi:hypothetical protein
MLISRGVVYCVTIALDDESASSSAAWSASAACLKVSISSAKSIEPSPSGASAVGIERREIDDERLGGRAHVVHELRRLDRGDGDRLLGVGRHLRDLGEGRARLVDQRVRVRLDGAVRVARAAELHREDAREIRSEVERVGAAEGRREIAQHRRVGRLEEVDLGRDAVHH